MKKVVPLILILVCFHQLKLSGQCMTAGPNNGNVFSGNVSPGDQSWFTPGAAKVADNNYAVSGFVLSLLSVSPTKFLTASDYRFNIPPNAVIRGIQVDISRLSDGINLLAKIGDESVRVMKGGTFVGANKASNNYWPIFNSAYQSYGGPTDLWGTTWTPADINSTGFGAGISANLTGLLMLLPSANVDHIRVSVYYSLVPVVSVTSSSICAGTSATLTATGGTSYSWTPAPSSVSGGTAIVTPTATTTYTVMNVAGICSNSTTITVNVDPMPVISVSSGSASSTICQGDSISLSVGPASSYSWTPATGLSSANSANIKASPAATTIYSVYATGFNGCSNTMSPATYTVNVNAAPVINLNANVNTICSGGSTILSASGADSYTWSPAAGLSSVNSASVVASPTVTTVYHVTGTSLSGCQSLSAADVTVTVNNTPTLSVLSTAAGNTICRGQSTTLSALGASSYTWSPSTGLNTVTGANVIASPSVTTVYTVNTSLSGSCAGSASSGTIAVIVNNGPTLTSSSASSTIICEGSSTPLAVSGATSYTWSPVTGLSSTNGPTVTASPSVTTVYTVTGTAANGCDNSYNPTVFTVSVNPAPVVNINSGATTGTLCQGSSATLTASGATSYSWSPSTGLNTSTGPVVIANPSVTTVYTLQATASNGCSNSTVAPFTYTLTVNTVPTVSLSSSSGSYSICQGSNVSLTASGATSYTWGPASSLNISNGPAVIASPTVTTVYTVTAQSSNGCSNASAPQTVTVTVYANPEISLSSSIPGDSICLGQPVTISVSGAMTTYTWSNGMSGQSITVTPTVSTIYDVISTNSHGCTASGSVYVVVINPDSVHLALMSYSASTQLNTAVSTNVSGGALPNIPALITITQNPAHGTATISNGVIVYTPANNYEGTDTVYYAICDQHCLKACKSARLVITIESDIRIPGVLSPNGDGVNDHFYIKGLSKYNDPELVVFNRWGDIVFSAKPYNNDWSGQSSSKGLTISGSQVLDGTYYYFLTLEEGEKPIKGFFEVKRK